MRPFLKLFFAFFNMGRSSITMRPPFYFSSG
jgi:hypothetical protein